MNAALRWVDRPRRRGERAAVRPLARLLLGAARPRRGRRAVPRGPRPCRSRAPLTQAARRGTGHLRAARGRLELGHRLGQGSRSPRRSPPWTGFGDARDRPSARRDGRAGAAAVRRRHRPRQRQFERYIDRARPVAARHRPGLPVLLRVQPRHAGRRGRALPRRTRRAARARRPVGHRDGAHPARRVHRAARRPCRLDRRADRGGGDRPRARRLGRPDLHRGQARASSTRGPATSPRPRPRWPRCERAARCAAVTSDNDRWVAFMRAELAWREGDYAESARCCAAVLAAMRGHTGAAGGSRCAPRSRPGWRCGAAHAGGRAAERRAARRGARRRGRLDGAPGARRGARRLRRPPRAPVRRRRPAPRRPLLGAAHAVRGAFDESSPDAPPARATRPARPSAPRRPVPPTASVARTSATTRPSRSPASRWPRARSPTAITLSIIHNGFGLLSQANAEPAAGGGTQPRAASGHTLWGQVRRR